VTRQQKSEMLHASAVSLENHAVLIIGASGSGKSSLALELMSRGAGLIADDYTDLTEVDGVLVARAPAEIRGRIEARGVGVLVTNPAPPAPVVLAVDLDKAEIDRLPEPKFLQILSHRIPLVLAGNHPNPAPAIKLLLSGGRAA